MTNPSFIMHRLLAFFLFPIAFICFVAAFFFQATGSGAAYVVLLGSMGILAFVACAYFISIKH